MNFQKIALISALFSLVNFTALDFDSIQAQSWTSYLSESQINDLVDTGEDLLLATDAGLVVVNKTTLERSIFNTGNSNIPRNHIQSITEDFEGQVWIGTYDVILSRFDGEDFQDNIVPENEDFNTENTQLYDLKIAPNGDLWTGTSHGIFRKSGEEWMHYDEEELGETFFEAWDISINELGDVLIGSTDVFKFSNGNWTNISQDSGVNGYLDADLFRSSTGDLFFSGDLDKIGRFDGENWETNGFDLEINGSEVVKFTEDQDGNMYLNTLRDGVFKLNNGLWEQQEDLLDVSFNNATDYFYIDSENTLWMNNDIHLIKSANGETSSTLISDFTLESNGIQAVHKAPNGSMYFFTYSSNIAVLDTEGNWSAVPLPSGDNEIILFADILVDTSGDIWLADFAGLFQYSNSNWTFFDLGPCRSLAMDSNGKKYVHTDNGITIIENGEWSEYNQSNSPISFPLAGLGIDEANNLWLARFGENVLYKVSSQGTDWETFDGTNTSDIDLLGGSIHFDINGNAWIPADNVGAIKFDGENFSNPYVGNIGEMANYAVTDISSDAEGTLYFAHQFGVTTWTDNSWGDLLIEQVPAVFTSASSALEFDNSGNLWWGSNREGLFAYDTGITSALENLTMAEMQFNLYPNPAEDFVSVQLSFQKQASAQIQLFNTVGQMVKFTDLGKVRTGNQKHRLNIADLPIGLYTLQVKINGSMTSKKLLIN